MSKKNDKVQAFPLDLQIEWKVPENIIRRYATNMYVQLGENEFFISFFEVIPPAFSGTPEQMAEQAKNLKTVQANCVASIIVVPEKLPSFIRVLEQMMENYLAQQQKETPVSAAILASRPPE